MAMPLGSGALAGPQLGSRPRRERRGARLRAPVAELDRRRLQPRLRARLPLRGDRLRDPPLAPGRGDRALVEQRVRLLRARRCLRLGLEPDAAEEEPRRGRAAAGEVGARARLAGDARRRDARAAARLRQGPPGGQGGAVRRGRHDRAVPRGRRADARGACTFDRERMAAAAADEMVAATDVADLLVRRGCRSARPTASSAGSCAPRSSPGDRCRSSSREELAAHSELLDDEYYEVLAEGAWLDSKVSAGGTGSAPLAEQLEKARRVVAITARDAGERPPRRCLLRPLGPRRRARPDRLRAARRRRRRRHRRDREL